MVSPIRKTENPPPTEELVRRIPPEEAAPPPKRRRWLLWGIVAALVMAGIIVGVIWWINSLKYESTDDAFLDAHTVAIAPKVASYVTTVPVNDNQHVHQGQVLVQLDPRDLEAALAQAQANLTAAKAEENQAKVTLARYLSAPPGAVSAQDITNAQATEQTAVAKVAQMQAALEAARLQRSYATITAPVNGYVTNRSVEPGTYVQIGQSLMAIVPENVYVTANFKETQLTHMKPGDPVEIKIDAYPRYTFKGHVDSIQKGSGAAFSLLPPENATGNYVKVVQRVPVKIVFDERPPANLVMAPGMSVVPTVKIK